MLKKVHRPMIGPRRGHGLKAYRVLARKKGLACDVEITEAGGDPRIVIAFGTEAEAWEWVTEQQAMSRIATGKAKRGQARG